MILKWKEIEYRCRACMGEMRRPCKILVRKFEEKKPLGRRSHIYEDNIKTYHK
jgi:hypothetical protein